MSNMDREGRQYLTKSEMIRAIKAAEYSSKNNSDYCHEIRNGKLLVYYIGGLYEELIEIYELKG